MFDLKKIRQDPEAFDEGLKRRGLPPQAADILELDAAKREQMVLGQEAQAKRNALSKQVGQKKAAGEDADELMKLVGVLKQEVGNGPRITQRAWLAVEAHHNGTDVHSDVLSGYGDADVLIPGLRGKHLKIIRDGQLYVRPGWSFSMVHGSAAVVEGDGWKVELTWTDERPEGVAPREV